MKIVKQLQCAPELLLGPESLVLKLNEARGWFEAARLLQGRNRRLNWVTYRGEAVEAKRLVKTVATVASSLLYTVRNYKILLIFGALKSG